MVPASQHAPPAKCNGTNRQAEISTGPSIGLIGECPFPVPLAWGVAVEAVWREPVSAANSLLNPKKQAISGCVFDFDRIFRHLLRNRGSSEQGLLTAEQGIFVSKQAIRCVKQTVHPMERTSRVGRLCSHGSRGARLVFEKRRRRRPSHVRCRGQSGIDMLRLRLLSLTLSGPNRNRLCRPEGRGQGRCAPSTSGRITSAIRSGGVPGGKNPR